MSSSISANCAAISAEVKRGELRRFYVKQIESARVEEFSKMYDEEGRFIRGSDALLRSMEPGVPPQQSRTIQTGVPNAS